MRESKVEAYLVERVKATGGLVRKAQWIGQRGCPDRWCGWPSTKRRAWVETKKPLTPNAEDHQKREHDKLRACGERVFVLATLEAVDQFVTLMSQP